MKKNNINNEYFIGYKLLVDIFNNDDLCLGIEQAFDELKNYLNCSDIILFKNQDNFQYKIYNSNFESNNSKLTNIIINNIAHYIEQKKYFDLDSTIVKSISSMSYVIKGAAGFILCYIPIMTTIMIASGQSISATSYHIMMIAAGQVISQVSSNFLVPCMNTVLGISIVSSTSEILNLDRICDMFHKIIKWILGFSVSIFVGLLTLQNLVSSSADSIGSKTMKFALTSFVPVVGSALSDAFNTVEGCIKLLKSGVGAFGVIAGGAIFMPIIIECSIWIIFLHICVYFGEIFELTKICSILKSSSKVMETMFAVIFASMLVLAVSTVLMLVIGGNG